MKTSLSMVETLVDCIAADLVAANSLVNVGLEH
jgi:hypothetical protein